MNERLGKRMRLIDATGSVSPRSLQISTTLYDIVPVRPKGWAIRVTSGQKISWAFNTTVFTWLGILDWMRAKYSLVKTKNDIFGESLCSFKDVEGIAFQEIDMPEGAQTAMVDKCPNDDTKDEPPLLPRQTCENPPMIKALPPAGPIKEVPQAVEETYLVMG